MNKTIKQAERYEAPNIKALAISLRERVLQTSSVTGNSITDMEEEEVTW